MTPRMVTRFDRDVDRGRSAIVHALGLIDVERMTQEAEAFVQALERDLIDARRLRGVTDVQARQQRSPWPRLARSISQNRCAALAPARDLVVDTYGRAPRSGRSSGTASPDSNDAPAVSRIDGRRDKHATHMRESRPRRARGDVMGEVLRLEPGGSLGDRCPISRHRGGPAGRLSRSSCSSRSCVLRTGAAESCPARSSSAWWKARARLRSSSLSAGPGWGKTTLLAQWASASQRPFAWLSVDERDNDPIVLLTYVAVALDRVVAARSECVRRAGVTRRVGRGDGRPAPGRGSGDDRPAACPGPGRPAPAR